MAVVVTQLVKRSLPNPEVRGSSPVKAKIIKKRPGMDHFFKKKHLLLIDFTYAQRIPHVKARSNERTHVPISSSRLQRRLAATKAVSRFAASTEKEEKASKRSSASDT